jgi:hypothetical protein
MTPTKSSADRTSSTNPVQELLEQRSQIQQWLTNLDSVGSEANSRVVERVRADYSDRLDAVIDELAEHLETIRADRDERHQQLEEASQRLQSVSEELEEARLRHMIGEISEEAWRDRQPELGDAVTEAEADREDARAEVARLDELLRQIEEDQDASPATGSTAAGESGSDDQDQENRAAKADKWDAPAGGYDDVGASAGGPDSDAESGAAGTNTAASGAIGEMEDSDALVYLSAESELEKSMFDLDAVGAVDTPPADAAADVSFGDLEDGSDADLGIYRGPLDPLAFLSELPGTDETTVEQPSSQPEEFEFLKQLDRAISEPDDAADSGPAVNTEEDTEQFRPTPGTKCPECGYTNDPEAWYCGVCGVDLA